MEIRRLTEIKEYEQVIQLQRLIWQMSDLEIQPIDTFAVMNKTGGGTIAAFEGPDMIGFCLGFPAIKDNGKRFLHSHMLGVLPEYSNQGVGRALKLWQREWAKSRGFNLIEWTFDPLQVKNTFFNIECLGAIVRQCYFNLYGQTSNALDAGLPTDRCVAEWWLDSTRVVGTVDRHAAIPQSIIDRLRIPANTQALRTTNIDAARELQRDIMSRLSSYFADGLALIGVDRFNSNYAEYLIGYCDELTSSE